MKSIDAGVSASTTVTVFSIVLVGFFLFGIADGKQFLDVQSSAFTRARDVAYQQVEDQSFLDTNQSDFKKLAENKVSVSQRKMQWVELLQGAKLHLGLSEVSFEIYPSVTLLEVGSELSVAVQQETIDIKLGLLHEGNLLEFFHYLEQASSHPFEITSLQVERQAMDKSSRSGNAETHPTQINLLVHCTISWYPIEVTGESLEAI